MQNIKRRDMASTSSAVPDSLQVFDGKNFDDWRVKMNAIFGFQDVEDVVEVGFQELGRNATKE